MKKSFAWFSVVVLCFFAISLVMVGNAAAQKKPVTLKLVIATPKGDYPQTFRDEEMAKRFNERAKGEYQIEVFSGGALAKLPEFFDAVRIGAVEMEFSNWGTFAFMDPRLSIMETPFLFESSAAQNSAFKEMTPLFDKILQEKFNAKALAMCSTGGLGIWARKPVKTLEDMKGLLTASVSPVTSTFIKAVNASPVTMPFPDIFEALQKKIVDGAAMSAHGGINFAYPDVCKNFTSAFTIPAPAGYTINLDVWKKMPPNIQKILLEETQKACDWMNKVVVSELPDKDLKALKEKGVTVYYLPKEERARWAKQLEPYREKQFSSYGDLGQKIKKIAEEANKKHPYVADKTAL
jgi:TRAP-type C4-dicarboxylate transport system substrate-binding protein